MTLQPMWWIYERGARKRKLEEEIQRRGSVKRKNKQYILPTYIYIGIRREKKINKSDVQNDASAGEMVDVYKYSLETIEIPRVFGM